MSKPWDNENTPVSDSDDLYDYQTAVETCKELERRLRHAERCMRGIVIGAESADANDWIDALNKIERHLAAASIDGGTSGVNLREKAASAVAEWNSLPFSPPDDFKPVLIRYRLDGGIRHAVAYIDGDGEWMHEVPGERIPVRGVVFGWRECGSLPELPKGCGYMGHDFGASYLDSKCFGCRLYDLDNGENGMLYEPMEHIACPECNHEEWLKPILEDVENEGACAADDEKPRQCPIKVDGMRYPNDFEAVTAAWYRGYDEHKATMAENDKNQRRA